jgi:Leucine rich repeat/Leucine Rich Repeat
VKTSTQQRILDALEGQFSAISTDKQIVDVVCGSSTDAQTCEIVDFAVISPETQIISVKDRRGIEVQPTRLIIRKQAAMFLPANIYSAFPALEHLEVSESRLLLVDDQTFHGLGEIKSLNLTANKLTTIGSGSFAYLNELESFDLSSNRIDSIRLDAFVGLGKLKVLDLNNNKLGKIASTFLSPMPLLELLDLGNNSCIDLRHPQVSLEAIKAATITSCVKPIEL